jgi:hypothetical protein
VLWSAPRRLSGDDPTSPRARGRLELTVDSDGSVIDVRFPALRTLGASHLRDVALTWTFEPILYDGKPQLVRFEIESDGTAIGPSSGGGAPAEVGGEVAAPTPAVRVDLPPGREAPKTPTKLRLSVDGGGGVTEAALQVSCGDAELDKAAADAALRMIFTPVEVSTNPDGTPKTRAVYLNIEARFVEAPTGS